MSLAIIGGTGLDQLDGLNIEEQITLSTPYGAPSAPVVRGVYAGKSVYFLARHGQQHQFPPHRVNYCANIHALKQLDVEQIIAVNAVGGITAQQGPAAVSVPDQLIDYTWGRRSSYWDDEHAPMLHIDFTHPYADRTRQLLLAAARQAGVTAVDGGVYGCTQGPRLETAAEIARMKRDGCDIVGMTAIPEAPLARELELDYASLCVVANWAAGCTDELITMAMIDETLAIGMQHIRNILQAMLQLHY